ncbi:OST-HTH/LOTUS domain-containing protein [Microbacterium awajiense]|uniref:OST-HTH/LOTUS domain-containing protein n=1 Tax=Microbacterium awajiense TaxID=415214 RepID=UPI0031DFC6B0
MPAAKLRTDGRLVSLLRASVGNASSEDGWAQLSTVGSMMRKQQPDFDSRNWGYAKLSDLVREVGMFTVAENPGGGLRVQAKERKSAG